MAQQSDIPFLSASLRATYRTYKGSTTVVLTWLFDDEFSSDETDERSFLKVSVREILEKARSVAHRRFSPPATVHNAFKLAIINRHKLTQHYDRLSDWSKATIDSNNRHKHFNETLAQAYGHLFPGSIILSLSELGDTAQPVVSGGRLKGKARKEAKKHAVESALSRARLHSQLPAPDVSINNFEALSNHIEEESTYNETEVLSSDVFTSQDTSKDKHTVVIDNDPLEEFIAVHLYIHEVQALISWNKSVWAAVAGGSCSMTLAGCITNWAAYALKLKTPSQSPLFSDHVTMAVRYSLVQDSLNASHGQSATDFGTQTPAARDETDCLTEGLGLFWPVKAILGKAGKFEVNPTSTQFATMHEHIRSSEQETKLFTPTMLAKAKTAMVRSVQDLSVTEHLQDPSVFTVPDDMPLVADSYTHQQETVALLAEGALVESVKQPRYTSPFLPSTIQQCPRDSLLVFFQPISHVPIMFDLLEYHLSTQPVPENFLERGMHFSSTTLKSGVVFAMNMFMESCKSYLYGGDTNTVCQDNCRLKALRLATEVRESIKLVRQLEDDPLTRGLCYGNPGIGILESLDKFTELLSAFTKENRFDLYHQAPWVAGNQMHAILANAQAIGISMFNFGGNLGSILHMYNLLRHYKLVPELSILEALCGSLGDKIFMGPRPTERFASIYFRLLGCGLDGTIDPQTHNRLDPNACSHFVNQFLFAQLRGNLEDFLKEFGHFEYSIDPTKQPKYWDPAGFIRDKPLPDVLAKYQHFIEREFTGPLPIATMNCFKLYMLNVKVWKAMGAKYGAPDGPEGVPSFLGHVAKAKTARLRMDHEPIHTKFGFQLQILIFQHVKIQLKMGYVYDFAGLNIMRDTLMAAFGDVTLQDVIWQGI